MPTQSPFPRSMSLTMATTDCMESSPSKSVGSARKRGICDSPCDPYDDCSSMGGGFSSSRHSVSRARIMTERDENEFYSLDVSDRICDFSMHSIAKTNKQAMMEIGSDDNESVQDSHEGLESEEEEKNPTRAPTPTFVPFEKRQSMGNFMDVSSRTTILQPDKAEVDQVIQSMSSYSDLKWLSKMLRKERESGGITWHVGLPRGWTTARRAAFIPWVLHSLGFVLRPGGGQMVFCQISKSKGEPILKLLDNTILTCKERGLDVKTPNDKEHHTREFLFGATQNTPKPPSELTFNSRGASTPDFSDVLDTALLQGMSNLGVNEKTPLPVLVPPVTTSFALDDDDEYAIRISRPSVENHSSSRDLTAHLYGTTPVPSRGRPPRLSLQSTGSMSAIKGVAASPYPQSTIKVKQFTTTECLETPMARQPVIWGAGPENGRDWGLSSACNAEILERMLNKLKDVEEDFGKKDSTTLGEIEEGTLRPFSLGMDLEAASNYRDPSTPDDLEETPNKQGFFHDGIDDMSPSSSSLFEAATETHSVHVENKALRRRQTSYAKHKRMSLFASAMNPVTNFLNSRKSLFHRAPVSSQTFEQKIHSEHAFGSHLSDLAPAVIAGTDSLSEWSHNEELLKRTFSFLSEPDLLRSASLVCTKWADMATEAHAQLMLSSVGCSSMSDDGYDSDTETTDLGKSASGMLEKSWNVLNNTFPWARFLAEGGFKSVFKVFNHQHRVEEAVSIMDINMLRDSGEVNVVGTELAVSVMVSALVRRGVCPNFVVTRGAFVCPHKPLAGQWGSEKNKTPKGPAYTSPAPTRFPKPPKREGRYQYIRMELCDKGDAEEYLKTLPDEQLPPWQAQHFLFQMAFALHASANKFSLKHYDIKLLNYFIQSVASKQSGDVVLRYGLGDQVFALRCPQECAMLAKLADYGTANVDSATNGQQVTIAQFTTLENTPADFMILGDNASQGHGHDNFGLGLCMLHLFTGHAPYEEIMEEVVCPGTLKGKLRHIWENEDEYEFSVIRSVILSNVDKDEQGHIIEGEPDEVLYDTFYRFLVLFGIPELSSPLRSSKVWIAVRECLEGITFAKPKTASRKRPSHDVSKYTRDCRKYSLSHGNNKYVARARATLNSMDGALELLYGLVAFDPDKRLSALDVLNSNFMLPLRESPGGIDQYGSDDDVRSFMSFATNSLS
eukprot:Nitzschia sp. Nitz4//scaffold39_size137210//25365//29046//NITZ4_003189-RA/size137210-processed-gene-0.85-mRNA-1//1//CDS//3329550353//802//frame0